MTSNHTGILIREASINHTGLPVLTQTPTSLGTVYETDTPGNFSHVSAPEILHKKQSCSLCSSSQHTPPPPPPSNALHYQMASFKQTLLHA